MVLLISKPRLFRGGRCGHARIPQGSPLGICNKQECTAALVDQSSHAMLRITLRLTTARHASLMSLDGHCAHMLTYTHPHRRLSSWHSTSTPDCRCVTTCRTHIATSRDSRHTNWPAMCAHVRSRAQSSNVQRRRREEDVRQGGWNAAALGPPCFVIDSRRRWLRSSLAC